MITSCSRELQIMDYRSYIQNLDFEFKLKKLCALDSQPSKPTQPKGMDDSEFHTRKARMIASSTRGNVTRSSLSSFQLAPSHTLSSS
jgi:hypothetical protein